MEELNEKKPIRLFQSRQYIILPIQKKDNFFPASNNPFKITVVELTDLTILIRNEDNDRLYDRTFISDFHKNYSILESL